MQTRKLVGAAWLTLTMASASVIFGQEAKVVEAEGNVVVTKVGAKPAGATVGMGLAAKDKLGTGESSRAVLQMSDKWFARIDEETDIEIMPGAMNAKDKNALKMALGGAFIYSREEEGEVRVQTPTATGGLRGTQLFVRVAANGKTFMQVLEGAVDLGNDLGSLSLKAGEAGEVNPGEAPHRTAVIESRNLLQWALYYPGVLVPADLGLSDGERHSLATSLTAYEQGDLLAALADFPESQTAPSAPIQTYHAAVLLGAGRVAKAQQLLKDLPDSAGKRALERLVAAVLAHELSPLPTAPSASEALAESYYEQSRAQLGAARVAARQATELAPRSGFAWVRLAELEFSFGRTRQALAALEHGLALAPRNAQAHALRGYLLSAEGSIAAAREEFRQAVVLDGGLGSGWLGLGLTKIKAGQLDAGTADLQTAATVEPTRSFFYSYHGKALSVAGKDILAQRDFDLAKQTDPGDPTPWLYSAIAAQQQNRYNDGIADLQQSIDRNDNRRIFRSEFLLDQDAAVRSSNLAKIYQDDGMTDLAVREATRAVDSDYTNASAHLFLANSFDALRDPELISLRYQTAWFNELLLANLLSPVGGGPLSQFVSQQEYSKLLAPDGIGGSSVTELRSHGYFSEQASVFGNFGRFSAGLDYLYHNNEGYRLNNDDLRRELWLQLKYQVTPDDTAYVLAHGRDQAGGDLFQSYSNVSNNAGSRFDDHQAPGLLLFGWNHHWAPGITTLFLGGRLESDLNQSSPDSEIFVIGRNGSAFNPGFLEPKPGGGLQYTDPVLRNATTSPVAFAPGGGFTVSPDFLRIIAPFLGQGLATGIGNDPFREASESRQVIYSAELEQIWQQGPNTLLLGGRWQSGRFDTTTRLDLLNPAHKNVYPVPAALQDVRGDFQRQSAYAYDYFNAARWLTLVAGFSWDRIKRPDNFRSVPINSKEVTTSRGNGKFGFTLAPSRWVTVRGAYTETLGGVSLDEDVRLEPVQFAGFNQAFRTVISESLASSVEAPVYHNKGLSIDGRLPSQTWWSASYNDLREDVDRTIGTFDALPIGAFPGGFGVLPSGMPEKLAYREQVTTLGLNQLVGKEFAFGATYRHTRAELHDAYPQIPLSVSIYADQFGSGVLDELALNANWNSPRGYFARGEAHWYAQDLSGVILGVDGATTPGDRFWQENLEAGYRWDHNLREVSAGVLNLSDRDYHLNPLTYLLELPHNRTFVVRCRIGF